jgi:hypothetical protein
MADHTIVEQTRAFMTQQRGTLLKERDGILAEQKALKGRLDAVNEVLAKFDSFEGKGSARKTGARNAPRARNGSRREAILAVVAENPDGLTRGELLEKMGLKGNKSGEMSVSNALTALAKGNKVARKGNKYVGA